jgi:hypothetical protein
MGQSVAGVVTVTSVDGWQVARTKADGTVGYTVSDLGQGTYMLIVTALVVPAPLRLWGPPLRDVASRWLRQLRPATDSQGFGAG